MRAVGSSIEHQISMQPSGAALKRAAALQEAALAIAGVRATGIGVGVYRFATHADANAHAEAAQSRVIAEQARRK